MMHEKVKPHDKNKEAVPKVKITGGNCVPEWLQEQMNEACQLPLGCLFTVSLNLVLVCCATS